MKILVITPSLPPSGGAESVAWELSQTLARDNEIHLLTFGRKECNEKIDNLNVCFLPKVKHNLRHYLTFGRRKIKKIEVQIRPDIIHAHMPTVFAHVLRRSSAHTMLTLHNSEFERYPLSVFESFIYKKTIMDFDTVTTVSNHMRKYFEEYFNRQIELIPNGVKTNNFKPVNGIKREDKTILYVGRLVKTKGVEKIFALARHLPEYKFKLVGDGPLINTVNLSNLEFVGLKDSRELPLFYNKAKYCLFPSKYENFPLVGLEAMACGAIVVAYAVGFREYIEDKKDGFLLTESEIDSVASLANKIIDLDNRKDLETIRVNAIKKAEGYDWSVITKQYLRFYQDRCPVCQ
jgi:glycosyltransferase involved in cell wall biosynthesis